MLLVLLVTLNDIITQIYISYWFIVELNHFKFSNLLAWIIMISFMASQLNIL
jgi:hypothetical protein